MVAICRHIATFAKKKDMIEIPSRNQKYKGELFLKWGEELKSKSFCWRSTFPSLTIKFPLNCKLKSASITATLDSCKFVQDVFFYLGQGYLPYYRERHSSVMKSLNRFWLSSYPLIYLVLPHTFWMLKYICNQYLTIFQFMHLNLISFSRLSI